MKDTLVLLSFALLKKKEEEDVPIHSLMHVSVGRGGGFFYFHFIYA